MLRFIMLFTILSLLQTEGFSCSCSKAWKNSFLSNINRFEVVALGTVTKGDSDFNFNLEISKLYKGEVVSSVIPLQTGGLDCKHMWFQLSGEKVLVGLSKKRWDNDNSKRYHASGCITSILLLKDSQLLTANSPKIGPAGQIRKPSVNMLNKSMALKRFEHKLKLRTLFRSPKIE
jgi:hypothetical protein